MQRVLTIDALPTSGIGASTAFFAEHLARARAILDRRDTASLAIVMPAADTAHDDWRRAVARDLAREYAPRRVNIIGGIGEGLDETLAYLRDALGVTGQYCPLND